MGSATSYHHPATRALLHALKYKRIKDAAEPLGELLARFLQNTGVSTQSTTIIPIPLSSKRERERGYNQAALITAALHARMLLPAPRADILVRVEHTKAQTELRTRAERVDNVRGCFMVTNAKAISGKTLLLVDDVYTTGATAIEAAHTVKCAGARSVIILTVARA